MRRHYHILAACGLVFVTAVWGSTFFLIKDLLDHMTAINFLGIRFLLAGIIVCIVFMRRLVNAKIQTWIHGSVLGIIYACAQVLQTIGLESTDASVSGFITGMYVVLTPLIVWLVFKTKISAMNIVSTILATGGLMALSLKGFAFGTGEIITFTGSVMYAIHIVVLGHWARKDDPLSVASIQIISIGIVCFCAALPMGITMPQTTTQWVSFLYMTIIAGIGALIVQTWSQSHLSAVRAAIILTMEPVFAAGFAIVFGGESLTLRLLLGGSLVLVAMFVTELWSAYQMPRDQVYKRAMALTPDKRKIIHKMQ